MTTIEATAVQQLAELDGRIVRLRHTLRALTSRRDAAERTLARAVADGAPATERRALSDAVLQADRDRAGIPEALELLEADRPAIVLDVLQEQQDAANAEGARLDLAYVKTVHEARDAFEAAASAYLGAHRRMNAARAAAIEAKRAAMRLAGADRLDIFYAEPTAVVLRGGDGFYEVGPLLARCGIGMEDERQQGSA